MDFVRSFTRRNTLQINHCLTAEESFGDQIDQLLIKAQEKVTDESILILIEKSIGALKYIQSFAHEYDHNGIPANGFRTILLTGFHALSLGVNEWIDHEDHIEEFKTLMKTHLDGLHYIHKIRAMTCSTKDTVIKDNDLLFNLFNSYMTSDSKALRPLYSRFAGVMFSSLSGFGRTIVKLIHFSIISLKSRWSTLIGCAIDSETYFRQVDYCVRTINVNLVKLIDIFAQKSLIRSTFRLISPSIKTWDMQVAPQSEYVLSLKFTEVDHESHVKIVRGQSTSQQRDAIRCLIVSSKSPGPYSGCVILHCHGGAFVTGAPELNLSFFINWAKEMPGCTIIAPQIGNAPEYRFPFQLQQLLDVYMRLITAPEDELKSTIGFVPEKVILSGDSSGAMHILGLAYALNDIRHGFNCCEDVQILPNLLMPRSVHVIYPAMTMSKSVVPSLLLTPHHFFITPHFCASTALTYAPHHPCVDTKILEEPIYHGYTESRMRHLFNQTNDYVLDHPYSNALGYQRLDTLRDVKLHVAAVKTDIWIDYSIHLLNKWQGASTFNVMGELCHGYLHMSFLGEVHSQAVKVTLDLMKDDFNQ